MLGARAEIKKEKGLSTTASDLNISIPGNVQGVSLARLMGLTIPVMNDL